MTVGFTVVPLSQALARRDEIGTRAKSAAFAASLRAIATPFLPVAGFLTRHLDH